jgi:hypothetical protein
LVLVPRRSASSAIARTNFALADRPHFLGAAGAIARSALDEDGADDVVPRVDIGQELIEEIAPARMVPEVMVRIDDRQIGLDDLLGPLAQPFRVG